MNKKFSAIFIMLMISGLFWCSKCWAPDRPIQDFYTPSVKAREERRRNVSDEAIRRKELDIEEQKVRAYEKRPRARTPDEADRETQDSERDRKIEKLNRKIDELNRKLDEANRKIEESEQKKRHRTEQ